MGSLARVPCYVRVSYRGRQAPAEAAESVLMFSEERGSAEWSCRSRDHREENSEDGEGHCGS